MIWALAILAGLLLYGVILWLVVRFTLRPFRLPVYLSPGGMGLPQENVVIAGTPGWWCPGESDIVALHLHGYMMNRCELVPTAHWLHSRGIGSLLVDMPGHGEAPGETRFGWPEREVVLNCARWIREQRPEARILLIGSSMGSAASAFAIAEEPSLFAGLVLDSAYTRMDLAMDGWWMVFGGRLVDLFMRPVRLFSAPVLGFRPKQVDVGQALKKVPFPVLVMHGTADRLIPPFHAEKNLEALGERGIPAWFEKRRHSEGRWMDPERYFAELESYLARL